MCTKPKGGPNPLHCHPGNIWQYRQNRLRLVARDLARFYNVPEEDTLRILVARGVAKWLAVRRDLIRTKDRWKGEVTASLERQRVAGEAHDVRSVWFERGYRKALEQCRAEVRALCHSERWRASDLDPELVELLDIWAMVAEDLEAS